MLNTSTEEKERSIVKPKTLITSFIPRQLSINFKSSSTIMNPTNVSLSSQHRLLLLQSISQFLQLNGFSKTLKYFLKEAKIEKDGGENSLIDIEEMCFEYLKSRDSAKETAVQKEQDTNPKGVTSSTKPEKVNENEGEETVDGANVKSKTKKKSKGGKDASEQVTEETQSKHTEKSEEIPASMPSEPAKKSKDKKKARKDKSENPDVDVQENQSEVAATNVEKKEKKSKKETIESKKAENNAADPNGPSSETVDKKKESKKEKKEKKSKKETIESKKAEDNATDPNGPSSETVDEKKESKKRKKPSSEENGDVQVEEATVENSKRRKTDSLNQSNGTVEPPKTPNGFADGVLEKDTKEKSQKHDKSKELNDSAEPKTAAKAFQRVKPEEVEFADERLQDNSYWAKDGADSGYGAKAQEVLGQVRGRDFRHEKTKKKRGSYRGGQIDLHTHSVKFNYEEEDE